MTRAVLREDRGPLRILTMNRPEARNAMNADLTAQMLEEGQDAAEDASVRAVILTGAEGYFCVGGDVKNMHAGVGAERSEDQKAADLRSRMEVSRILNEMPKPTIAAIEGAAAGAGLSLALACDFRVCAEDAKLTVAFAKVGLSGDYGGSYFLSQILGAAKLRELYMLSPILSGAEAAQMGLVTRAVESGAALEQAIVLGTRLAEGPTLALGRMKQNFLVTEHGGTLSDLLDSEARNHARSTVTADHKEAAAAFVEKRQPAFKGA